MFGYLLVFICLLRQWCMEIVLVKNYVNMVKSLCNKIRQKWPNLSTIHAQILIMKVNLFIWNYLSRSFCQNNKSPCRYVGTRPHYSSNLALCNFFPHKGKEHFEKDAFSWHWSYKEQYNNGRHQGWTRHWRQYITSKESILNTNKVCQNSILCHKKRCRSADSGEPGPTCNGKESNSSGNLTCKLRTRRKYFFRTLNINSCLKTGNLQELISHRWIRNPTPGSSRNKIHR